MVVSTPVKLVGGIPTPLKKYEFVSWDDDIPKKYNFVSSDDYSPYMEKCSNHQPGTTTTVG